MSRDKTEWEMSVHNCERKASLAEPTEGEWNLLLENETTDTKWSRLG